MLMFVLMSWCFVFFKQKTAYEMRISDWSSDVCSSDLHRRHAEQQVGDLGAQAAAEAGELEADRHALRRQQFVGQMPARPAFITTDHRPAVVADRKSVV